MRRRLDLALALVHRPHVLFLDEPTTGLDPTSRGALWREVRSLNDEGTTVFLTTQYLEEAEQLADRVGIIASGKLVAEGTPDALKARVGEPTLHVELADPDSAERARVALAGLGDLQPPDPARAGEGRAAQRRGQGRDPAGDPRARRARRRRRVDRGGDADARRRVRGRHRLAARGRDAVSREGRVVLALGRRALSVQFRRAQLLMPTFVLPLMLLAVIASGTSAAQDLRGFPDVGSYLAFVVPGTLIQGALLAGLTSGAALRGRHRVRLLRPAADRAGARARAS